MAVKKIGELTVEELVKELKKRGLDANGDRDELMLRLRKTLTEEKRAKGTPLSPIAAAGSSSSQTEKSSSLLVNKTATVVQAGSENRTPAAAHGPLEGKSPPTVSDQVEWETESSAWQNAGGNKIEEGQSVISKDESKLRKVADDPPFVFMVDESQNDLDDDIVCVSMTPGRGIQKAPTQTGTAERQKQVQKGIGTSAEKTSPTRESNAGVSTGKKTSEPDASKQDLSLWVNGLSSAIRAADLKTLFNTCGKVIGAKVVASAKSPGSKCYGIVTMASHEDTQKCLKELNNTTMQGQTITLELYSGRRAVVEKAIVGSATPTIWVSGIGPNTKAPDLKKLFVPHGKVVAASIVMNAVPGSLKRCGLVKMSTCEEADLCIQKVNKTSLDGRLITVERAKSNPVQQSKPASRPPPLMSQRSSLNQPMVPKPPSLLRPVSSSKGDISSSSRPSRLREADRPRRGFGGPRGRGDFSRKSRGMPVSNRMKFERDRQMMRMQEEQERSLKEKQAELLHAISMEYDKQKQREEAERLAYEREQLEIEKMKVERERIAAERLKVQLEQERRQHEREQMELERNRTEMFRNQPRLGPKRSVDRDEAYWDYLVKKRRDNSPASANIQNLGAGPGNMFQNTNVRLQQMADYGDRRMSEGRLKESIPSGNSSMAVNRSSSMFHPAAVDTPNDPGKSEWKSLYNMSTVQGNGSEQSQWKSLSSSSLGNVNAQFPSSSSSFRGRPYLSGNASSGFRMKSQYNSDAGFKSFGTGRGGGRGGGGGHKWR